MDVLTIVFTNLITTMKTWMWKWYVHLAGCMHSFFLHFREDTFFLKSNYYNQTMIKCVCLNPNWHEARQIYPLKIFELDLVGWIFIKNFQTFSEVKIEINWDNLTPCQAHLVLLIHLLLGGPKDEHLSYSYSSYQLGLKVSQI